MTKIKTVVAKLTTPKRTGSDMSVTFEVPSKALKDNAKDDVRAEGIDMLWIYDAKPATKGNKKGKNDTLDRDRTNKNKAKSDTSDIPREMYYPVTDVRLSSVEFWARVYNVQGSGQSRKKVYGEWEHKAFKFAKPASPSVAISYDSASGRVTPSYSTTHPDGKKDCSHTAVWLTIAGTPKLSGTRYTSVERSLGPYSVPDARQLGIGRFKKVTFSAQNLGLGGKSNKKSVPDLYVCHPNPPTCGKPELVFNTKGEYVTAMVRVPIKDSGTVVDGKVKIQPQSLKLQRLKNALSSTDVNGAASADGWQDVTTFEGATKGLSDEWIHSVSDAGKFTWYRAVAVRDGYETPGVPVYAEDVTVYESSVVAGAARIDSATAGADGKSVTLTFSGKDVDDKGYEASWSVDEDAWESTDPPDTYETTGSSLIVKKLTEGRRYFFKARAYDMDADGNYVYGRYSAAVDVTPVSTPSTVILDGPQTTPRGGSIALSWTYDTDAQQTEWRLVDGSGVVAYSGAGSSCAHLITPAQYGEASSLTYHVEMTTGGGWAKSEERTFAIADKPTCALTAPATLTVQPVELTVASDTGDSVLVVVTAEGCSGSGLDGDRDQLPGDTVYSAVLSPDWSGEDTQRSATVQLPGMALWNKATYIVEVTVTDTQTGLDSDTASSTMVIDWARTASQPTGTAEVDQEARTVTVTVGAPEDASADDTFDLYRVTSDGERRIASGLPFGTSVTDDRAPFSHDGQNLSYIAAHRTTDGDVCVSEDIEYSLACKSLRLDWGKRFIELPYNLAISDSFEKDSEVRKHMDGTRQAYWNAGVTRKASLSTDLIRFEDGEEQELLRDMLQHAGSVFVRTPDGLAYAADVQPGTIERSSGSGAVSVSLECTEHDLTDEDVPGEVDIVRPE